MTWQIGRVGVITILSCPFLLSLWGVWRRLPTPSSTAATGDLAAFFSWSTAVDGEAYSASDAGVSRIPNVSCNLRGRRKQTTRNRELSVSQLKNERNNLSRYLGNKILSDTEIAASTTLSTE